MTWASIARSRSCLLDGPTVDNRISPFWIEKPFVELGTHCQQAVCERFRQEIFDAEVNATAKRRSAFQGQGDVIPGEAQFFEPVAPLKLGDRTVPLIAVDIATIGE